MRRTDYKYDGNEKKAGLVGAVFTVTVHVLALTLFFFSGLHTVYPPPREQGILIEFEEDPQPIMVESGKEPRQPRPRIESEIKLAQKAEAQEESPVPQAGDEAEIGPDGDVEKYEPVKEKPIDRRALFTSAKNRKDTLAAQTAEKVSEALKAGHPQGNTVTGDISNDPTARLAGRSVVGSLPNPAYTVNKSGTVVVSIMVDQYGTVTNAIPGVKGTTVQDKVLWEAAKKAALGAKFNVSSKAPAVQKGTITYIFRLK